MAAKMYQLCLLLLLATAALSTNADLKDFLSRVRFPEKEETTPSRPIGLQEIPDIAESTPMERVISYAILPNGTTTDYIPVNGTVGWIVVDKHTITMSGAFPRLTIETDAQIVVYLTYKAQVVLSPRNYMYSWTIAANDTADIDLDYTCDNLGTNGDLYFLIANGDSIPANLTYSLMNVPPLLSIGGPQLQVIASQFDNRTQGQGWNSEIYPIRSNSSNPFTVIVDTHAGHLSQVGLVWGYCRQMPSNQYWSRCTLDSYDYNFYCNGSYEVTPASGIPYCGNYRYPSPQTYYQIEVPTAANIMFWLVVSTAVPNAQYNITVKDTLVTCANGCNGYAGLCHGTQCECNWPYTGPSCTSFVTTNTTSLALNTNRTVTMGPIPTTFVFSHSDSTQGLIFTISGVSGGVSVFIQKDASPNYPLLLTDSYYPADYNNLTFTYEVGPCMASGRWIFQLTDLTYEGDNFTVSVTTVKRQLAFNQPVTVAYDGYSYYRYFWYRLPANITKYNLHGVVTRFNYPLDYSEFGFEIYEADSCSDVDSGYAVAGVADMSECYLDPRKTYYLSVEMDESNFTIELQLTKDDNCNALHACNGHGTCSLDHCNCWQGWYTGADCSTFVNEVNVTVLPENTPFVVPKGYGHLAILHPPQDAVVKYHAPPTSDANVYLMTKPELYEVYGGNTEFWWCKSPSTIISYMYNYNTNDSLTWSVIPSNEVYITNGFSWSGSLTSRYWHLDAQGKHLIVNISASSANELSAFRYAAVDDYYFETNFEIGNCPMYDYYGTNSFGSYRTIEIDPCESGITGLWFGLLTNNGAAGNFTVTVSEYDGVQCPSCCNNLGECQDNGTCTCYPGWSGADCSVPQCMQLDLPQCSAYLSSSSVTPTVAGAYMYSEAVDSCGETNMTWAIVDALLQVYPAYQVSTESGPACLEATTQKYCQESFAPCSTVQGRATLQVPCEAECDAWYTTCLYDEYYGCGYSSEVACIDSSLTGYWAYYAQTWVNISATVECYPHSSTSGATGTPTAGATGSGNTGKVSGAHLLTPLASLVLLLGVAATWMTA